MPSDRESGAPLVATDVDLGALNTFGLPGRAARFAVIKDISDVSALVGSAGWNAIPRLVLGGGSNIVLTGDFPGLVLKVAIPGKACIGEDEHHWYVRAGAGENWHGFVRWTLEQGFSGLENLSLIPGTVGAAPIQNIGAYGVEMDTRFDSLEAVSLEDGTITRFDAAACRFGYRDSLFKREPAGRFLIESVTFRLPKRWVPVTGYADVERELVARRIGTPSATDISDAVIAIRSRKLPDPACIGNAGSFFKNPVVDPAVLSRLLSEFPAMPHYPQADGTQKLAAGWLIDQCGWKGRNLGPVGCFESQALVLVNRGGATGEDVRRAACAIQEDVARRFGVALEPEPVFV